MFSKDKHKYRLRIFQEQISLYNKIFLNLYFAEILKSSDRVLFLHRPYCYMYFIQYQLMHVF
jgi:hypothetical protein